MQNIIAALHLKGKGGTTDLFDTEGGLASFNYASERDHFDCEAFTYIRKDLLDEYLRTNDLIMYTLVWGSAIIIPETGTGRIAAE